MSEVQEPAVLLERRGQVALVTLNRPRVRNALDHAALDQLEQHVRAVAGATDLRALVITGAGDRAFCAGADLKALNSLDEAGARDWILRGQRIFDAIERLPLPVLAAINGFALGGGLELALACDLRLAADGALLGAPEVGLGWLPGWAGLRRLPALIGLPRALDLVLTARKIDAAEALGFGLVTRVTPPGQALEQALDLAGTIAGYRANAVALAKQALRDPTLGTEFDVAALVRLRRELGGAG